MGSVKTVGIIGAGQMGSGIAQVCALAGMDVLMHDVSAERIDKGMSTVGSGLSRQVASAKITEEARAKALTHVKAANAVGDLAPCDLVIEAVYESMDVKKDVFGKLDTICKQGAILASNTSSMANSAALALSVSKMVSTRIRSAPPSQRPRTASV